LAKDSAEAEPDPGLTTSVAVILMYGVGALLVIGPLEIGVVMGGAVAVLLQFKPELHRISERLKDEDVRAIMQSSLSLALSCRSCLETPWTAGGDQSLQCLDDGGFDCWH